MSTHIGAKKGEIADTVLLPGDPLRAKFIAKEFLTGVKHYTSTRNMLGFTGLGPEGRRVSVQGSGMGMPSLSIYVHELINDYDVKRIIRVGSCGSLQPDIKLRDIVLASGACSDSAINTRRFGGLHFAPVADWELLRTAYEMAGQLDIPVRVGNIVSADLFYTDHNPQEWKLWAEYGVLAVEMETAELYTLAAAKRVQALTILTVSDNLPNQEFTSSEEREKGFRKMVQLALSI